MRAESGVTKKCTKCKVDKSISMFSPDLRKKDGKAPWCKECNSHKRDLELKARTSKIYYKDNLKKIHALHKSYYLKNRESILKRIQTPENLSRRTELRRIHRMDLIAEYGGECECCYETAFEFLAIDHVNGGGTKHLREIKTDLGSWLRKNNYPKEGFRVLCHNCNSAFGFYGYCPHNNKNI
jgi:hypothetical protein